MTVTAERETETAVETELPVLFDAGLILNALMNVRHAAAKDKGGPVHLTGVNVRISPKGAVFTATDRYRAIIQTVTATHPAGGDAEWFEFTLSPAGVKEAINMLKPRKDHKPRGAAFAFANTGLRVYVTTNDGAPSHDTNTECGSNGLDILPGDYPDLRRLCEYTEGPFAAAAVTYYNPAYLALLGSLTLPDVVKNRRPSALAVMPDNNPAKGTKFAADGDGWSLIGCVMPVRKP